MDSPTQITEPSDWRSVLKAQGRSLRWLAAQTGKSSRTVYGYSRGELVPPRAWVTDALRVLGAEDAA